MSPCPSRWNEDRCILDRGHPDGEVYHVAASGRQWRRSEAIEEWLERLARERITPLLALALVACGPALPPPDPCECVLVPPADAEWVLPSMPADTIETCPERKPEHGCRQFCAPPELVEEYRQRYPDTFARFSRECGAWLLLPPGLMERLHGYGWDHAYDWWRWS